MTSSHLRATRKVVMRIHGEEIRRFHVDVVVEVPENVTDEQLERTWARQFDGMRDMVEWDLDCSTGIWPSNCGKRIRPEVRGAAPEEWTALIQLDKSPKGSLVVRVDRSI